MAEEEGKIEKTKGRKNARAHTHTKVTITNAILTKILFRMCSLSSGFRTITISSLVENQYARFYVCTTIHWIINEKRGKKQTFPTTHRPESMVIINNSRIHIAHTAHIYIDRKLPTRLRLALKRVSRGYKLNCCETPLVAYDIFHVFTYIV